MFRIVLCAALFAATLLPVAWAEDLELGEFDFKTDKKDPNVKALGHTPVRDLRDTKICWYGMECTFGCTMGLKIKEKAETADGKADRRTGSMTVKTKFTVTSQCGSKTHQFFRLNIIHYHSDKDNTKAAAAAMKKYPTFFSQRKDTGKIENVYGSRWEKKFARRIKHGLIESLSKKIHHTALKKIQKSPKGNAVSYLFEDEDTKGRFRAHHKLLSRGEGAYALLEKKEYDNKDSKKVHERVNGQHVDMDQKSKAKTEFGKDGRVRKLKEKDEVDVGTAKPLVGKDKPIVPTPSTGKTKFDNGNTIERLKKRRIKKQCRAGRPTKRFEADIDEALDGFVSRPLREPLSDAEMGGLDEDWAEVRAQPEKQLQKAQQLLQSQKTFAVYQLAKFVHPDNADPILRFAWQQFQDGRLTVTGIKKVFGAVSHIRTPEVYGHLLQLLHNSELDKDLRTQAVVCLIHSDYEVKPPWYVVDSVALLSHKEDDEMHHGATLLLGSLLSRHPESKTVRKHVNWMQAELSTMEPNNRKDAWRAVNLMGALGNAGHHHARRFAASIAPFARSRITAVREQARKVLIDLGLDDPLINYLTQKRTLRHVLRDHHPDADKPHYDHTKNAPPLPDFSDESDEDPEANLQEFDDDVSTPTEDEVQTEETPLTDDELDDVVSTPMWAPWDAKETRQESKTPEWKPWDPNYRGAKKTKEWKPWEPSTTNLMQMGGVKTFGGKKDFVKIDKVLAGAAIFCVKAKCLAGARWSPTSVAGHMHGYIKVKVFHYNREIVRVGLHGRIHPDMKKNSGCAGEWGFLVMVMGQEVLHEPMWKLKSSYIHMNAPCPKNVFSAKLARQRAPKMWFRTLFMFVKRIMAGPVPVKITVSVLGGIGYGIILGAYVNCDSKPGAMAGIIGAYPRGRVDVKMEAAVDIGIASAGIEGILLILRGDVPLYALGTVHNICGHMDLELEALSGKIMLVVKVLVMNFKITIIQWKGPTLQIPLLKICKSFGKKKMCQFSGKPKEKGPRYAKMDKDMKKNFGPKYSMFPSKDKKKPYTYDPRKGWPFKKFKKPAKKQPPPGPATRGRTNQEWPWNMGKSKLKKFQDAIKKEDQKRMEEEKQKQGGGGGGGGGNGGSHSGGSGGSHSGGSGGSHSGGSDSGGSGGAGHSSDSGSLEDENRRKDDHHREEDDRKGEHSGGHHGDEGHHGDDGSHNGGDHDDEHASDEGHHGDDGSHNGGDHDDEHASDEGHHGDGDGHNGGDHDDEHASDEGHDGDDDGHNGDGGHDGGSSEGGHHHGGRSSHGSGAAGSGSGGSGAGGGSAGSTSGGSKGGSSDHESKSSTGRDRLRFGSGKIARMVRKKQEECNPACMARRMEARIAKKREKGIGLGYDRAAPPHEGAVPSSWHHEEAVGKDEPEEMPAAIKGGGRFVHVEPYEAQAAAAHEVQRLAHAVIRGHEEEQPLKIPTPHMVGGTHGVPSKFQVQAEDHLSSTKYDPNAGETSGVPHDFRVAASDDIDEGPTPVTDPAAMPESEQMAASLAKALHEEEMGQGQEDLAALDNRQPPGVPNQTDAYEAADSDELADGEDPLAAMLVGSP